MEISNNSYNYSSNEVKEKKENSSIPYYLLSLDEQEDEFISSDSGKTFVSECKQILDEKINGAND